MERSYAVLREMLRAGDFAPGARLDANRLADEFGVSMTPVRDALHRLAGERLVDASSGEGFHVPQFTENELRHLYEWNAAILTMAVRTIPPTVLTQALTDMSDSRPIGDRTSAAFDCIGDLAPNNELRIAIHGSTSRLNPFRIVEPMALGVAEEELAKMFDVDFNPAQEIRRYHLRRMRVVADLLQYRAHRFRKKIL